MIDFCGVYDDFEACETIDAVKRVASCALLGLGCSQFVYLCWSNETLSVELSIRTYSEAWADRYVSEGYDGIDPVIGQAFASKKPFTWSAADHRGDDRVERFFEEAAQFGLYQGVTTTLKTDAKRRIFVTFSANEGAAKFEAAIARPDFLAVVKFLALALHRAVSRIQAGHIKLLTRREAEVMKMAGVGLTSEEIGAALVLSKRTVDEALTNATRKLGQENKAGAVHMLGGNFTKMTKPA